MKSKKEGYTLIELLLTLSLILAGCIIALPAYQGMVQRHTRTQSTNELLGLIHFSRYTAAIERTTISLCPARQNKCHISQQWSDELLVFYDPNQNGQLDDNETLLKVLQLTPDSTWMWRNFRRRSYLQFNPNGQPSALNGTFTLCQDGLQTQKIIINVLGRPRTERLSKKVPCTE